VADAEVAGTAQDTRAGPDPHDGLHHGHDPARHVEHGHTEHDGHAQHHGHADRYPDRTSGGTYTDMNVLAGLVKDTCNTKYRRGGPVATDASCISTSPTAAECNLSLADGSSSSIGVTISADGSSWISHQ